MGHLLGGSLPHIESRRPTLIEPKPRLPHLNETLFRSLAHARAVLATWQDDYNHVRPHGALGGLTPAEAAMLARLIHDEHNHHAGLQP